MTLKLVGRKNRTGSVKLKDYSEGFEGPVWLDVTVPVTLVKGSEHRNIQGHKEGGLHEACKYILCPRGS